MGKISNENIKADLDKVLVVEDEKYTRLIIEKLLKKNNYEVYTATNGRDALDVVDEIKPKLIIADWNMPVLNGIDLCKTVKRNNKLKSIYFILFTAKISLEDRVEGLDSGADDFMIKPTENEELLARVRTGIRIVNFQSEITKIEHDKAIIEMACTIGHQMSNPLNSLIFSLKSLQDKLNSRETKRLNEEMNLVKLSIEKIQILTNELIKLEKPEMTDYNSGLKMLKID